MEYRTHLTTSLAVSLPILASTGYLTTGNVTAICLGALLPDIDEPHSWIGRRTRGVSDLIHGIFGHRGMTHSLLGVAFVLMLVLLVIKMTPLSFVTGFCVVIGYCLHLIGDSFSKSGVKWLLPFSNKKYQSGFNIIYYRTGSVVETVLLLVSVVVLLIEVYTFRMMFAVLPEITEGFNVKELIGTIMSFVGFLVDKIKRFI